MSTEVFYKLNCEDITYDFIHTNNKYTYNTYKNNSLIQESKNSPQVKNIYHIINNINKLSPGKIKKYNITTQLELETLSDFLKTNNTPFLISFVWDKLSHKENISYEYYKSSIKLYNTYFSTKTHKIMKNYKLYIKVYKGFTRLHINTKPVDNVKFGVYLYNTYNK